MGGIAPDRLTRTSPTGLAKARKTCYNVGMDKLTVVIQAGGESRRMGSPKALVPFRGAPLICRGLKRLGPIADELLVTTNDERSLSFLCRSVTFDKLKMHSDIYERRSALNGLHTALHYANCPYVAIVACDMVFPSAPLLVAERDLLVSTGADLAVPCTSHGYEPFHAVYRKETCLPIVRAALDAGETRATAWFEDVNMICLDHAMVLAADPRGGAFINVNTPQELMDVESRLLEGTIREANEADLIYSASVMDATHAHSACAHYECGRLTSLECPSAL
jgi:molybdopterin-guanine dinucleotide biosynthesis protein A